MVAYKRAVADADEWSRLYAFIDAEHVAKGKPDVPQLLHSRSTNLHFLIACNLLCKSTLMIMQIQIESQ